MSRFALLAALLALAACGGAPPAGGSQNAVGGDQPRAGDGNANTGTPGADGGTELDGGVDPDAGTDAGVPAVVTYSLDCTGAAIDATLTYHYEARDDGHVLTHCTGTSAQGAGEQSNEWGPDVTGGELNRRDEGQCGFYLDVSGGTDGGGFSCQKTGGKGESFCEYFDDGPLTHTVAYLDCAVTTP